MNNAADILGLVTEVLDDRKGENIVTLNVAEMTHITDHMVLVTGTSNRHVKALVDYLAEAVKSAGFAVRATEGRETHEWVLMDLGDVLVHVMQAEARDFYDLERLWGNLPTDTESSV